ncbi:hypothetical protein GOBAR_DD08191 [Gossypium barbadense]|nr:hypothetical protein GOBAR_DD08191 [Gossypium barbadense]
METEYMFVEDVKDTIVANRRRARRCDCKRFQTLHYPCAHVLVACALTSLSVEQFIDEVYTFERTLRV